jgi:hypothetical protein
MIESLYQRLTPLKLDDAEAVIHDPDDYPHLGRLSTIPVALIEFPILAGIFPLLWQEGLQHHEPVALTGIIPGQGVLLSLTGGQEKPLLFLSYPFAAPHYDGASDKVAILLDAAPLGPAATSELIFKSDGKLNQKAQRAAQALQVFLADRPRTLALSASLAQAGAFVPWQNRLSFEDDAIALGGLLAIDNDFEETQAYTELLTKHGPLFALVVECHRISLKQFQALAAMTGSSGDAS